MPFLTHQRTSTTTTTPAPAAGTTARAATMGTSKLRRCEAHVNVPAEVAAHHDHITGPNQCCSVVQNTVAAPLSEVWAVVSRFDRPQAYKQFLRSCQVVCGDGRSVGTVREVRVVSGLPASTSRERLEILDDEQHVLSFRIVGGEHRLANYLSVTTLHPALGDPGATVVVESYVVDVPPGNTTGDTRVFVDTIVRCNHRSLARVSEAAAGRMRQQKESG